MRASFLIAGAFCAVQALALGVAAPARAEIPPLPMPKPESAEKTAPAVEADQPDTPSAPAAPPAAGEPPAAETPAAGTPPVETAQPSGPAHPVVEIIRAKLADPELRKDAHPSDLAALEVFYARRTEAPLWMTDMGFTARGQAALFEIGNADAWGLDQASFDLPPPGALPSGPEEQAVAEIKLDLAILKYARFARGGRFKLEEISGLIDQEPPVRDPSMVLTEVAAADAPGAYLQSLHPKHDQFARLRQALAKARGETVEDAKAEAHATDIRRIVLNMERWRWLPEDLGETYVWLNTPNFMLYIVKDGKTVYTDKTQVGTIGYATPIFSADMKTIVFNPEWIAPRTVLNETLLPPLRKKNYDFLKKHRFTVYRGGKPVNVSKIKWTRENIHNYAFVQKPGPGNNLGKIKLLYPNKHDVYMHDTLPVRKKVFEKPHRAIGYGCVRMEKPAELAEILLAEDQAMPASQVKELWDKSVNRSVAINGRIPVHTTYFTALVDEKGKVSTFADLYGIDRKLADAIYGDPKGFPVPPPEARKRQASGASQQASRTSSGSALGGALQSLLGN